MLVVVSEHGTVRVLARMHARDIDAIDVACMNACEDSALVDAVAFMRYYLCTPAWV